MCDGSCALSAAGRERVALDCDGLEDGCAAAGADGGDAGVSRRAFITRSTLAAVAAVLAGACGDGIIGGRSPTGVAALPAGGISLRLADYPALAQVGGIARADTAVGPIALVRTGAASFAAFSMVCPHQGTTINIQGSGFTCPNHGAKFDAAGTWIGGQPTSNLAAYAVTFDAAAGTLLVGTGAGAPPPPTQQNPPPTQGNVGSLVVDLSKFPALAKVGGVARVDGGTGVPVGAARLSATQFAAYTLACTHQGTTVNLSGSTWVCPNHGARFDSTGKVTLGPATTNLAPLAATYDATANTLTIAGAGSGSTPPPQRGGHDDDGHDDG